jgi:hypothetical protein
MKVRVYLRVAPTSRGFRVAATTRPSSEPLRGSNGDGLQTFAFVVVFDLPANVFDPPQLAEVAVPAEALTPIAEAEVET